MGSTDSQCCGSHGLVASDDPNSKTIKQHRKEYQNTEATEPILPIPSHTPLPSDSHNLYINEHKTNSISALSPQPHSHYKRQHSISQTSKIDNHTFEITANVTVNSSTDLKYYNALPSIILNFDGLNNNTHSKTAPMPQLIPQLPTNTQTVYTQYTNTKNNFNNNYSPIFQSDRSHLHKQAQEIIKKHKMNIPSNEEHKIDLISSKNENVSNYENSHSHNYRTNWIENHYEQMEESNNDDDDDILDDNDTLKLQTTNTDNGDETDGISYLSDAPNSGHLPSVHSTEEEHKYDLENMPLLMLAENNSDIGVSAVKPKPVNYLTNDELLPMSAPKHLRNMTTEELGNEMAEMRRQMEKIRKDSVSTYDTKSSNSYDTKSTISGSTITNSTSLSSLNSL